MADAGDMECCSLRVILILDHQVNDLSDMSGFIGGTINTVDQDCSRQSMSLYVLQPYELDVNEHPSGSQVDKSFDKHGGVAVYRAGA